MIHAKNFVQSEKFQRDHLDIYPDPNYVYSTDENEEKNSNFIIHNYGVEGGPVVVQLAGHDADIMCRAADRIISLTEGQIDGIDINLGCPQSIARKGRYGAFLMLEEGDIMYNIMRQMRAALPRDIALSAKIRVVANDDDQSSVLLDKVHRMQEAGIDLLTVHGRTVKENKTAVRGCNWDKIRLVVDALDIPVVANGGIEYASDVVRCIEATGAVGVMSSEALLENPSLFAASASAGDGDGAKTNTDDCELTGRALMERQFRLAEEYLHLAKEHPPLSGSLGRNGVHAVVKSHIFKMLYRFIDEHHDIRDQLGNSRETYNMEHIMALVKELKGRYYVESSSSSLSSSCSKDALVYTVDSSWYRRHPRTGGNDDPNGVVAAQSMDDKKAAIRERILKMKQKREVTTSRSTAAAAAAV